MKRNLILARYGSLAATGVVDRRPQVMTIVKTLNRATEPEAAPDMCVVEACRNQARNDSPYCHRCLVAKESELFEADMVERELRRQERRERFDRGLKAVVEFGCWARDLERQYGWIAALILFVTCASAIAFSWVGALLCAR